jgi:hypothetical protein
MCPFVPSARHAGQGLTMTLNSSCILEEKDYREAVRTHQKKIESLQ